MRRRPTDPTKRRRSQPSSARRGVQVQRSKSKSPRRGASGEYTISWRANATGVGSIGVRVRAAVRAALRRHDVRSARISVIGVSDKQMARLNEGHLRHRGATDVLTFDLSTVPAEVDGEIVLSLDRARREAVRRGHAVSSEAALYAVHGVLHLLGYDDHEPRHAERMHRMEDEVLSRLGLGAVYSTRTKVRSG